MQQRSVGLVAEHSPMVDALMTPSNPFHENDEEFAPSPVGGLTPTHVLRANVSSVSSSFASAAAALPRNTMSDGDGAVPPYYPYEHQQYGDEAMAAAHNGPPASAPMLSPPYQQGISFSQPQWPNMSQQEVAVVGGPRVEYSDPFANASFNPFDDLDDHQPAAAVAAAPASNSSFFPFPTARPSASHSAVPEYHPAPYVPVPYQPVAAPAAVVAPPAPVVVLGASELEAVGEQDGEVEEEVVDGDTFEDAEGLAGGEVGEEEPEGIPSAALAAPAPAAAPAHVPMPTPIPAAVVAAAPPSPPYAAPPPPAVVPSPPRSSFASLHSASAPRPPTIPPRSPTSMPPPPPSLSPHTTDFQTCASSSTSTGRGPRTAQPIFSQPLRRRLSAVMVGSFHLEFCISLLFSCVCCKVCFVVVDAEVYLLQSVDAGAMLNMGNCMKRSRKMHDTGMLL